MKNRIVSISLAVVLALSVGIIGCGSEEVPEITECNLTVSSTEGGLVTSPGEATFTYDEGSAVNLTAEAEEGYRFVNWIGDVDTVDDVNAASTTITMQGNYSVTANFEGDEAEEDGAVTFPDPDLEAAIRQAISKPAGPIYASDLGGLTHLYVGQRNISNLSGLDRCTSLIYLILDDNQISDVSPLANLTSLTILYLAYNQISDISPLADLTSLTLLYLHDNQVSNISPLANLTSLTWLSLGSNSQISDISPLANLTSLETLLLQNNQISVISPLVQNDGLGTGDIIDLSGNPLSSTSFNIYIPQLEARGVEVVW